MGDEASSGTNAPPLNRVVRTFERAVVVSLIGMMMLVVALSAVELGWLILVDLLTPPIILLEVKELLEIFGFFLLVLIGVELLETIKAYLRDDIIHVEIVAEVALIALARKVIVLDLDDYTGITLLAVAALIVALTLALLLARRLSKSRRRHGLPGPIPHVPRPSHTSSYR